MLIFKLKLAKANKKKQLKKQAIIVVILLIAHFGNQLIIGSANNQVIQYIHLFVNILLLISLGAVVWFAGKNRRAINALETLTIWLANDKIANLLMESELSDFCIPFYPAKLIFRDDNYKISLLKKYLTEINCVLNHRDAFVLETFYQYEDAKDKNEINNC